MTKEEAHKERKELEDMMGGEYPLSSEQLIDEIYDDFESRSCENCKYKGDGATCTHKDTVQFNRVCLEIDWVGCGRWEKKDD